MLGDSHNILRKVFSLINERKEFEVTVVQILKEEVGKEFDPKKDFSFQKNVLVFHVPSVLRSEVLLHKSKLLERINEQAPEGAKIVDIR